MTWRRWAPPTPADAFPPPSRRLPRFAAEAARDDQVIADTVRTVAEAKNLTPAQVALAWVTAQAPRLDVPVVPIPGTRRVHRLEQNPAALGVTLSSHELAALGPLACQVVGARYDPRPAAAARRDDNRLP